MLKNNKFSCGLLFLGVITVILVAALAGGIAGVYVTRNQFLTPETTPETVTITTTPARAPIQISTTDYATTITQTVEKTGPSVVTVLGVVPGQMTIFGRTSDQTISGSGFFITEDGYLLTNNHVVEGTKEVSVILSDGTQLPAVVVGTDKFADLAVLKAEGEIPASATLGNSDALKRGETVIAIGSPLGDFNNTVTVGVISAMDRRLNLNENYQMEGLIQTDAAINEGNSGGPLINLAGEVIGINTIIVRGGAKTIAEGLGFAIPSNMAKMVAEQIIAKGYFARPYLGIRWEWVTPRLAQAYDLPVEWGAYISEMVSGSPAQKAGLRVGDIITHIGEQALNENNPYINVLYDHAPQESVILTVQRGKKTLEIEVTLGKVPQP